MKTAVKDAVKAATAANEDNSESETGKPDTGKQARSRKTKGKKQEEAA